MRIGNAVLSAILAVTIAGICSTTTAREALDAQLTLSPERIFYPANAKPGVAIVYKIMLSNTGTSDLAFTSVTDIEDSAKGPGAGPTNWMTIADAPSGIPAGNTDSMTVTLNAGGVITSGPTVLFGKVRFVFTPPDQTIDLGIQFTIADPIVEPVWDTVSTACVDLSVGTNGNMGQNGIGFANLDFAGSPSECDTGLNSRGDARIYLRDASPIIIRQPSPGVYRGSWSLYDDGFTSPHGFKPVSGAGYAPHGSFSTSSYDAFNSGTFLTVDSLIKCEMTWWAPKSADSCNFIVQRLRIFPAAIGSAIANLQIGLYYDFDIPSDSGSNLNVGGTSCLYNMAWQGGFNSADGQSDCIDNSTRYAGVGSVFGFMKNKLCFEAIHSAQTIGVDRLTSSTGQLISDSLSYFMHTPGYASDTRITDQASIMTIKDGPNGYTLPANDTLTIFSVLAAVPSAASAGAGLDSLKRATERGREWLLMNGISHCGGCCFGVAGNVNLTGVVDLADLSALVSHLTGGGYVFPCYGEANINAVGIVDLSDLSYLVCYLTGGGCTLLNCPAWPYTGPGCN